MCNAAEVMPKCFLLSLICFSLLLQFRALSDQIYKSAEYIPQTCSERNRATGRMDLKWLNGWRNRVLRIFLFSRTGSRLKVEKLQLHGFCDFNFINLDNTLGEGRVKKTEEKKEPSLLYYKKSVIY